MMSRLLPPRTQVVIARTDGTAEEVVLDRPGIWAADDWSPDGKRLLLSYMSSPILQRASSALYDLDLAEARAQSASGAVPDNPAGTSSQHVPEGHGLRPILPVARGLARNCRYSPDGKSIALVGPIIVPRPEGLIDPKEYASGVVLSLYDLTAAQSRVLCSTGDIFGGPICWSPDGAEILFTRFLNAESASQGNPDVQTDIHAIWAVQFDGQGLRRITTGWCPDWQAAPGQ
jgi:hypothetical protein